MTILAQLIKKLAEALCILESKNMVHGDLNTDNILIKLDKQHKTLDQVMLVDFGSSFKYQTEIIAELSTR